MLTKKQNEEIREHLEKAQNPLFYFDNDQDGLCSYLLLARFLGRGNGIPVKTSPLGMEYFRRVDEFEPDYVFILDQPTVSDEFFNALRERNIPVVWIDHHEIDLESIPSWVEYYNPLYTEDKTNEPVTEICYELVGKKDIWLSVAGCIADKYLPKEYNLFLEKYSDLGIEASEPFDIFYGSEIGKISRMIGAGLKDRTSLVMKMIRFLKKVKTPYEILEENIENNEMHKRFNKLDEKLKKYLERAKEELIDEKILFFKYSGETSMSADLANRLSYEHKDKIVVVAYEKGARVNVSIRGKSVKQKVLEALKEFRLSRGGGHNDAVGCQLDLSELEEFVEKLRSLF
jgi:single-stranded DNA-specific DHH superfamily exonuclease